MPRGGARTPFRQVLDLRRARNRSSARRRLYSATVAGRPMILVRGDDKVIRVLLNTCTHRGALVCRQKSGNARTFQCPYHAWTFNSRGQLVGVPGEESYSEAFSRDELRLVSPAQVDSYRGFIFVCSDPAAVSLSASLPGLR